MKAGAHPSTVHDMTQMHMPQIRQCLDISENLFVGLFTVKTLQKLYINCLLFEVEAQVSTGKVGAFWL